MGDDFFKKINFPYSNIREGQDKCIKEIYKTIAVNSQILINAPTGLGKTISALAPAIYQAKKKGLKLVCLTSKKTQVNQIISTIEDINEVKNDDKVKAVAFIGKKNMCVRNSDDFSQESESYDLCKKTSEPGKCNYCKKQRKSDEIEVEDLLEELSRENLSIEKYIEICRENNFCPYQVALLQAQRSDIIICDYNYFFVKKIFEGFLGALSLNLEECILIVDEAHNLPDRVREAYSKTLSTETLKFARKELKDTKLSLREYEDYLFYLEETLGDLFIKKRKNNNREFLITKNEFVEMYEKKLKEPLDIAIEKFKQIECVVLKQENRSESYNGNIGGFLSFWLDISDDVYVRILEIKTKKGRDVISLKIRCLDPSPITKLILENAHSSILMSATLTPINMYKDILGVNMAKTLELDSPFKRENQLTLIDDTITTKFTHRSLETYKKIAQRIKLVLKTIGDKNSIFFFPSYDLLNKITFEINVTSLNKRVLKEKRNMSKEEKERYIDEFKKKSFNLKPVVLFAVTSGSFGEGLDLPNEYLEVVGVVGLPLGVPNYYTQSLINYYDKKFNKGQLYGYIFPALSKIIQAGGRCIRTQEDRGVVILFDNRFLQNVYIRSFPKHWHIKKSINLEEEIISFFKPLSSKIYK